MANLLINIFSWFFIIIAVISMFMSKANASETWTKETFLLQKKIVKMWVQLPIAKTIIDECKRTAKNPLKCVKTTVAIYWNESWFWKRCRNNSCWWIVSKKYSSKKEASIDFIARYNRFWYKHDWAFFFYWNRGKLWASKYCTSEESSNSSVGCPIWASNFQYFYNKM